jgi:hypothetical protein
VQCKVGKMSVKGGKMNGRCEGVRKVGKNRVEGKEDDLGRWEM